MRSKLFLKILERLVWTFIQGTTSTLLLSGFLETEAWKAAVVGGLAAMLSLIKSYAGTKIGDPNSPAWLPATVTATGTVAGEITGTVVDTAGEVLGDVTGTVLGALDDDDNNEETPDAQHP
jgi:hypothetical protein